MNEDYTPPIADRDGLLVDRWLGAHIAQGMLDWGNVYLCHTVPGFREVWDGLGTVAMEGYMEVRNPPGWVQHDINVIRAGLVLFGDSTITSEYHDMKTRVAALHQSIRDVIDALNLGELTEAIIQETIDERVSLS